MKNLILISAISFLGFHNPSQAAPHPYIYECECQEDEFECEGGERMNVVVGEKMISFTRTDKDGDFPMSLVGTRDTKYNPKKYKNYYRYYHTNKSEQKSFPYLLVEKTIYRGEGKGTIRLPEFIGKGKERGHSTTWEFSCIKAG